MKEKRNWKATAMMVWDTLFVLVLCFAVLLTTMLLTRSSGGGEQSAYHISAPILLGVAGSLAIYLAYMLTRSLRSLKRIQGKCLAKEKEEGGK